MIRNWLVICQQVEANGIVHNFFEIHNSNYSLINFFSTSISVLLNCLYLNPFYFFPPKFLPILLGQVSEWASASCVVTCQLVLRNFWQECMLSCCFSGCPDLPFIHYISRVQSCFFWLKRNTEWGCSSQVAHATAKYVAATFAKCVWLA